MLISLLGAGVTCALAIRLFAPLARAIGWIDRPDARKIHTGDVPLVGGLAIFAGSTVGGLLAPSAPSPCKALWLTGGLLMLVGAIDDRVGLSAWHRLGAQAAVSSTMLVFSPVGASLLRDFQRGELVAGVMAALVVFLAVALINAVNLMDGVDMLAGSLILIGAAGALWLSPVSVMTTPLFLLMITVACFLTFNAGWFKPRIFLGDAGSTLLAHVCFWSTLGSAEFLSTEMLFTPLWCMAIPLFDMTAVVLHRITAGHPPLAPDRNHLHHVLGDLGIGKRVVVGIIVILSLLMVAVGELSSQSSDTVQMTSMLGAGVAYLVWVRRLRALCRLSLGVSRVQHP
jgi:UDP-GlcNAc:undecaprenyl-phosphate/decaprenyl-phosphate GlcNAc-1-phosphate transferase